MKIIKVVHQDSPDLKISPQINHLSNSFDSNKFLSQESENILERVKLTYKMNFFENLLKNGENIADFAFLSALIAIPGGTEAYRRLYSDKKHRDALVKLTIETTVEEIVTHFQSYSEQVQVTSLELARSQYPNSSNLSLGTYTLHPRDTKRLTRLERYHKNLALEKDDELIILLGRMGAKTLRIVEKDSDSESGAASVGAKTIFVDGKIDTQLSGKIEVGKELVVEFEGKPVQIDPNLLKNSLWFSDDSKLLSIFESRCYNPNKIQKYTLRNTYTESFDFNFDLAAKYLVFKGDLKAEYQSVSKKERFFHIEFG
ncbi:hypothetical protein [Synechococcus sp. PCC 6312]|uniref:hypothetical protein n=1 Tax=Synechococcus sp. (strain ATCC 27167 / PCC 6312) TaxID=195253 RepID=UPI00029ED8EA|nr:hypothetical protein [Synechococcus sp. PCC 6312]AFY60821.1 hypothetical protein Syn6312_1663 [Synechococcus sp. PCC 6312]